MATASMGRLPRKGETVRNGKIVSDWDPTGYKRVSKKNLSRYYSEHGYSIDKIPMRAIVDPNTGKKYKVPVDDYNNYVTFTRDTSMTDDLEKYIAGAKFGTDEAKNEKYGSYALEGCGHIKYIEYDGWRMLLRVTFWNDDIVVYFRVPEAVAGQLAIYAESKQTQIGQDGKTERHLLGIRFWDLVRIRKTVHGSRFRFRYTNIGMGNVQPDVDWVGKDYVFATDVKDGKWKPISKEKLNATGKTRLAESIQYAQEDEPIDDYDSKQSIKNMLIHVNNLPMEQRVKDGLIRKLKSFNGDEAAMRNYLGILGLYQ